MSQNILNHALIMAAGRGNRMRPLTDLLPKPMLNYKGDTLIGNSLQMLGKDVNHIHVTVGYKKALLSEYLMTRGGVDTIINTEGHDNAWWIQHTVMRFVNEPILVLTTDNITEIDVEFLSSEYIRLKQPPCMLVPVLPIEGVEGDYIEHDSDIVKSLQRTEVKETYCSGIQILNPTAIADICHNNDESFYSVWKKLIDLQQLKVSAVYPKIWFSIDTLEQLVRASQ